jgi:hypothetical protein
VLGDARLQIQGAPLNFYRWIVLDAFSSDVIPVHLLTREAMQVYLAKLAPNGFIVFHISNHYLDFEPVIASLTQDSGMTALLQHDENTAMAVRGIGKFTSDWIVAARQPEDLAALAQDPRWRTLKGASSAVWSDDYSNLVRIIRWN